ncbi:hypothetical protein BT69DRAFT_1315235 [Atractiella rhizophila]|nr:hypothetical protein BT69DRAFT_1315235 [Atractiella rhizophila]
MQTRNSPRCPALFLSEEALDIILYFLASANRSRTHYEPPPIASLRSFALVTRRWTASAQRALYNTPDPILIFNGRRKAMILLEALEGNPGLGNCVKNLDRLGNWCMILKNQAGGSSESVSEYGFRIISACKSLRFLDLPIIVKDDKSRVLNAMKELKNLELIRIARGVLESMNDELPAYGEEGPAPNRWTIEDLAVIATSLPSMRELQICSSFFNAEEPPPPFIASTDPPLAVEASDGVETNLDWSIRGLTIEDPGFPSPTQIRKLVGRGERLQSLTLRQIYNNIPVLEEVIPQLGASLTNLFIEFPLNDQEERLTRTRNNQAVAQDVLRIVHASSCSTTLERLVIRNVSYCFVELELLAASFQNLRQFYLIGHPAWDVTPPGKEMLLENVSRLFENKDTFPSLQSGWFDVVDMVGNWDSIRQFRSSLREKRNISILIND